MEKPISEMSLREIDELQKSLRAEMDDENERHGKESNRIFALLSACTRRELSILSESVTP